MKVGLCFLKFNYNKSEGIKVFPRDCVSMVASQRVFVLFYQTFMRQVYKALTAIGSSSKLQLSSAQSLSHVQLFVTPWITAHQASLSITNSRSSLRLTSIKSVMPSSHLILCHPLLLLPSIPPSIRVFSNESTLPMRWPKYWSFSFSISPSNEYSGLISYRIDRISLQSKGLSRVFSNTTVQNHQFFGAQLSYRPTLTFIHEHWKNHSLD